MIDIDKYEGHTPAPWYWDGNLCNDEYSDKHGTEQWAVLDWELGVGDADKQLIADAPLLLQEVKRLREGYKKIARDYDFNAIISQGRNRMRPSLDVDTEHGVKVTYHQKACLRIMELFEND